MPAIVQITYNFDAPPKEWAAAYPPERAYPFLEIPGLVWKIWLDDSARQRSGAIFLFDSRASAEAYLATPQGSRHKANPKLSNVVVEVFDIREEVTAITRGPIQIGAGA